LSQVDGQLSIRTLIQGCLINQRRAQELLYRQYYAYVLDIAARYTRSDEDAIELLCRSFISIFKEIHSFDSSRIIFRNWVKRHIIQHSIDFNAERLKYNEAVDGVSLPEPLDYQELISQIRKLPAAVQLVFVLHELEHLTHAEIAVLLKISEEESKWHYAEGQKLLPKLPGYLDITNLGCPVELPEKASETWLCIASQLEKEMPSDDDNFGIISEKGPLMSVNAEKSWKGWSFLILMGALCLVMLRYAGVKGKQVPVIESRIKSYKVIKPLRKTDIRQSVGIKSVNF
jgi:DNA-directed RNA polymerase specialized sigma24 family protein